MGNGPMEMSCTQQHLLILSPSTDLLMTIATYTILSQNKQCYVVNIEGINQVLHILVKNLHIHVPPKIIFYSEQFKGDNIISVPLLDASFEETSCHQQGAIQNMSALLKEDIVELHCHGIKVDNENEPAPENDGPQYMLSLAHGLLRISSPVLVVQMQRSPSSKENGKISSKRIQRLTEFDLI